MKILIVLAHPEPKSFNMALFQTAIMSLRDMEHEVKTSDLYGMKFDPVSNRHNFISVKDELFLKLQLEEIYATKIKGFAYDLNVEQEKVQWCDLIIWQFPLWWFSLPAILKGWADRVFAMGKFFGNGRMYEKGVLKGKKAILSITTGGTSEDYLKDGIFGDINQILKPIHKGIFEFMGMSVLQSQIHYAVGHLSQDERKILLELWDKRLKNIFTEKAINVGKY